MTLHRTCLASARVEMIRLMQRYFYPIIYICPINVCLNLINQKYAFNVNVLYKTVLDYYDIRSNNAKTS